MFCKETAKCCLSRAIRTDWAQTVAAAEEFYLMLCSLMRAASRWSTLAALQPESACLWRFRAGCSPAGGTNFMDSSTIRHPVVLYGSRRGLPNAVLFLYQSHNKISWSMVAIRLRRTGASANCVFDNVESGICNSGKVCTSAASFIGKSR